MVYRYCVDCDTFLIDRLAFIFLLAPSKRMTWLKPHIEVEKMKSILNCQY